MVSRRIRHCPAHWYWCFGASSVTSWRPSSPPNRGLRLNLVSRHTWWKCSSSITYRREHSGPSKMSSGDYASVPSTGKLKLKGVKDAKVDKKKKKKKAKEDSGGGEDGSFEDRSVMLRKLEDEDQQLVKEERKKMGMADGEDVSPGPRTEDDEVSTRLKTEAERRYEEQRRKRVCIPRENAWIY